MTVRSAIHSALLVCWVAGGCAIASTALAQTTWTEQKITAPSSGTAPSYFGYSVAVSGATALVGAAQAMVNGNAHQGAVYVFHEANGTWKQTQKLVANDGAAGDEFGASVAISRTTALIGAYGSAVMGDPYQGAVYVFHEANETWTQTQKLTASGGKTGSLFGLSLALSGDTAIIGAPNYTWSPSATSSPSGAGKVYIFTESNGTWAQKQVLIGNPAVDNTSCLNPQNPDLVRQFGAAVALSGSTALVSAQGTDAGVGNIVYVYSNRGGVWCQTQRLTEASGAASDEFGSALALSGTTALVSAFGATAHGRPYQGIVYVFHQENDSWMLTQTLTAGDGEAGDLFGLGVALSGSTALISAPTAPVNGHADQGVAYLFRESNGLCTQTHKFTASDGVAGDEFGVSVALAGSAALIGVTPAANAKRRPGAAYFYDASSPPPPPNPSDSGGGSLAWPGLAGMLILALDGAWLRRRRLSMSSADFVGEKAAMPKSALNSRALRKALLKILGLAIISTVILLPTTGLGATASPPSTTALRRIIHADLVGYLHTRSAIEHASAISVSISLPDNPDNLNVTAGTLRFGGNRPVTPITMFQVGSNTKSFTSAMILQLEAEGKLSIADKLSKWLDPAQNGWPPWWGPITIKQLLNMTSRIYDQFQSPAFYSDYASDPTAYFTPKQYIAYAVDHKRQSDGWYYSNTDYSLVRLILQKITGKSYTDLFNNRIRTSLDFSNMFINGAVTPKPILKQMASGYWFSAYPPAQPLSIYYGKDVSGFTVTGEASGGLITTPENITRWIRDLFQGRVLQPAQFDEMTSLVSQIDGTSIPNTCTPVMQPQGFGLGVGHLCLPGYGSVWFYEGKTYGYRMLRMYFTATDTVIAIGINSHPDGDKLTNLLLSIYDILQSQHVISSA